MKEIRTEDAVGQVLCQDITQIISGVKKGPVFKKGHIVTKEDIPVLLQVGKENLYVWEKTEGMLHEDEAAAWLLEVCRNEYMTAGEPSEGKIELRAEIDGLLKVDSHHLLQVNSLGGMMIATRHGNTVVHQGDKLAGMRVIPLVIEEERMKQMKSVCEGKKLLQLLPFRRKRVAVLTTGSEVYHGRIQDQFTPVLERKLGAYGCEIVMHEILDDKPDQITEAIYRAVYARNVDLVLCTGGMSVDPDDRTPLAIRNTNARIISYGAPVLPGAMFLMAYLGRTPVLGLPGCVMYAGHTVFDLVLPRVLADDEIKASELAALGEGGLCLGCPECSYPNCGFGR